MKGVSISTMLISVLMSFAGKIIAALGIGFVTYSGSDYMQIFYIGGGGVFLNWIFGAVAFIASIKSMSHLTAIMKKS